MKKITLVLLIVILLITGCGDDGDKEAFVATYPTDILVLSPLGEVAANSKRVLRNMNEGIYKYDEKGMLTPGIAESVDVSMEDDFIIFDIKLKPGIKFHNGKELNSEDVKYSYERLAGMVDGITTDMVAGGGIWQNLLNGNEERGFKKGKIELIDDLNLKVYLDNSFGVLTAQHSLADGFLVPSNYTELEQREHPIGVGPYKFVSHTPGSNINFERFEDYYGELPEIELVEFRKYSDQATIPLAFYSGEVDLLELNNESYDKVKSDGYEIVDSLSNDVRVMYMNQRKGRIFENKDLRVAINHAINKEKMLKAISNGKGVILDSHLTPFLEEYYNSELKNYYEYDIEKAKHYLKKSGYENGIELELKTVVQNEVEQDIAALIIEDLEKVGIKVKNVAMPWNNFYEEVYVGHDFDLALLNVVGYPEPFKVLSRYETGQSGNMPGFSNERYDKLLVEAQMNIDHKESVEIYKELQEILTKDAVGVFTIDPGRSVALGEGYTGYKNYPFAYVDISSIKRR